MSKYAGEQILVIKRSLFDDLGAFQGSSKHVDQYVPSILDPANNFFMDRAAAEEDPSHKQIIPYAIFRCGDKYLHYQRAKAGGEARLHAKRSLGIGGHINPIDQREDHLGLETYLAGVVREIDEELNIEGDYEQTMLGLINDDSNEVGKVHLGVVHLVELADTRVISNEDAIADLKFSKLAELRSEYFDTLESWSQLCLDILEKEQS